ncbi:MAG: galactokinase [Anaerolineaceae bacterium]|nr:galactokinase [Anaerolineaceae bacterium]
MSLQEQVISEFQERYDGAPAYVVRAPGRVNLIGEHTDYNDGFVMPMAIDRATWIALSPRNDGQVKLYSMDFNETVSFSLGHFENNDSGWLEYVKGMAWVLKAAGYRLNGWNGVIAGDVPVAAGLSSSAAVELATARAFAAISDVPWQPAVIARLAQRAENEWVGVSCGIMDQMISAAGVEGTALLIDCRSLETTNAPLPPDTAVVVLDTATRRGLVDSAYNERRSQCEEAARFFGVAALRDVSLADFEARAGELDDLTRRRARHVITENDRTLAAAEAMKAGDAVTLGKLMNASHTSLRDDFEVSSDALNSMVNCAQGHAGCFGARMTGAGFGGCAVALVAVDQVDDFVAHVEQCYQQATDLQPNIYVCQPTNGAELLRG